MKRFFALVMSIVLALGLMAGCGGKTEKTPSTAVSATEGGLISTAKVVFAADGSTDYRVVRPDGCETEIVSAASVIVKNFKDALGVKIKNVADSEDGSDQYEILVGNTNRPESRQALDYIYSKGYGRSEDYIICTIGKKIVILGINDTATVNAAAYFVNNILSENGVEGGIEHINVTEGSFTDITVNGVGIQRFKLVRDYTNRSWLIQEEVRKLQEYVLATTGFQMPLLNDREVSEAEYEINIGNTSRTAKPSDEYSRDEWDILIADRKVYITGGSTYSVQVAVTEFCKMVQKGAITDADSKSGSYDKTVAGYDNKSYYRVTWAEEFDYDGALDMSKWNPKMGNQHEKATQVIDEVTSSVNDGVLIMRCFKVSDQQYLHHTGISTEENLRYNFGYIEMRARIADGTGVYTSFWGGGDGLELDIFESLGIAHNQQCNIHYWGAALAPDDEDHHTSLDSVVSSVNRRYYHEHGTLFDDFHTVSMYWTPEEIKFIYDGEVYYYEPGDVRWQNKFINVVAGINVGWDGRTLPDDELFSDDKRPEYHIDYIRLYQIDGQGLRSYW